MIWGFVDYENTGSLAGFQASNYDRIFVFCGPNNNKLKLGDLPTTEFSRIDLIKIQSTGANNLDFHLSFYLGRLHETSPTKTVFHIISNDTGFNGIINHLNKIGRKCKRISTKKTSLAKNPTTSPNNSKEKTKHLSDGAILTITRLKKIGGSKRPSKQSTLENWIKSQTRHLKPPVSAKKIYEELKLDGKIKTVTSGITYHL